MSTIVLIVVEDDLLEYKVTIDREMSLGEMLKNVMAPGDERSLTNDGNDYTRMPSFIKIGDYLQDGDVLRLEKRPKVRKLNSDRAKEKAAEKKLSKQQIK